MSTVLYTTKLPGASHWSFIMRRGTKLRITDLMGDANVGMLFYNPSNLFERYNAPDTLKGQHTFKLTRGNCLFSDMGRVFASIVDDTVGWHETMSGNCNRELVKERWGDRDYQNDRNDWFQNGHDAFLVELAKYGLKRQDMVSNLNLFSQVRVNDAGQMSWQPGNSQAGDSVTLRFDMDSLVFLHTCPHPMNTATRYPFHPVRLELMLAEPVANDDPCQNHRPENQRGFENNRLYHLGL